VQGNSLYARDRIDAVGGIFCSNVIQSNRGDDLAFYAPYGGCTIATAFVSNRGGGQPGLYIPYADGQIGGNLSLGGNINCNNNVYGNYFQSNTGIYAAGQITGNPIVSNGDANVAGVVYAHDVMPTVDNGGICGGASSAWNTVESYYFATKSDRALKEVLGPLPDTLPMVVGLDPQAFQYSSGDAIRHWGFVAQDVQAAAQDYPVDIVRGEEGHLSVDYGALTAALWRAVQTIDQRLKALEGA
jgi:hypothetical protein